jgi:hypothetical protein
MHAAPNVLAAVLDAHPARRPPERVGPGIDRIGQNVVHYVVGRQSPDDATRLATAGLHWQLDALVAQPDMHLTRALELGKFREDEPQRILHSLIRVLLNPVAPDFHIACCNTEDQRAAALPSLLDNLIGDERNVLLTLARMWRTATGEFVTKDAAAEWAISRLPEQIAEVLICARDAYLGRTKDAWKTHQTEVR